MENPKSTLNKKMVRAIIPAYNEEEFIFETVRAVLSIPEIESVLVVDDGSLDETAHLARLAGAEVFSLPFQTGKGDALNQGIKNLTADVIVFLDGDLGSSAREVRRLIIPILEGKADMAIAHFLKDSGKAGFGLAKQLAKKSIKFYTGLVMQSPLSGQRALTKEVLHYVTPFAPGFGVEVALTIKAARGGFRIIEVPARMNHKETGRDLNGFFHRGNQFWQIARTLWALRI